MEPIKPINLREASDRNVTENLHLNPNLREDINRVSGNENDTINIHITGPDGSAISSEKLRIHAAPKEIVIEIHGVGGGEGGQQPEIISGGKRPPRPHLPEDMSEMLRKTVIREINTKEVGLDSQTKLVFTTPVKEAMQ